MALDATQFKQTIEALTNGSDLFSYHIGAVESEKQRGIEESRKANAEAQNLRRYKIAIEKLGYNKDADLDEFMSSLKVATEKAGQADQAKMSLEQITQELTKLKSDFSKTSTELVAERQRADEIKQNAMKRTLKSKLVDQLRDKVYGPDFVVDSLITSGQVVLGDDESVQFIDGTNKLSLEQGIQKLLETRSDIVKNSQRPGASSTAPAGTTQVKYTQDQINLMSKDDIRANLKDIKASLGISS